MYDDQVKDGREAILFRPPRTSPLGRDLPVAEHLSWMAANVASGGKAAGRRRLNSGDAQSCSPNLFAIRAQPHEASASSSALPSFKSSVSKPSVNQP